jgi:serine/threonine protein kinase
MTQNNTPKDKPEDVASDTDRSPLENESKTEPAKLEPDNTEAEFLDSFSLMDAIKEVESAPPESDNEEADFFDGIKLTDEVQTDEVPVPDHDADTDPDHEETAFFDSGSLLDELQAAEPSQAEPEPDSDSDPDHEATAFFDSGSLLDELQAAEPSQAEPEPDSDPDHEATAFFDSGSLMDELQAAEPSQAEPEPDSDPDHEATAFFDSGSLMDELQAAEPSTARPGRDHIEDAGGEPPLGVEAETVAGKEPTAPAETKKFGNYEVVKLLGTGGFGSVWQATAADGMPVAVKVLNPDILDNERAVRKFFHEAINLSKMNHPHICRFIDFFPQEGNYAIVMDFVQGTDLQDLLKEQGGPLPFETARQIAAQALDALHYAHQKQVLHRDIKPENITLTSEGAVKIMDFGIARLSSSESQQTSLFMISPAYTAPERFDETKTDDVDQRADIYSLGLVFYEIFTGKHPFPTTNPMEMIMAHLNTVPPPPDEIADLPQEISDAILKALEKNPDDRFEDFAAFKMEMLGEAPLRASDSIGPLELLGESCKAGAALLKTLSGIVKKHQKQAKKITVGQVGEQVNVIIETTGGNELCITRNLER